LPSNLCDHKPVLLIYKKKKQLHHLQIERRFLSDPELISSTKLAVFETHLQHADLDRNLTLDQKNDLLNIIGTNYQRIQTLKNLKERSAETDYDENLQMEIDRLRALINMDILDLPEPVFFENLSLSCEDDLFFEILINNMRNSALSIQSASFKNLKLKTSRLKNLLKELKMNFDVNANEIFEIENQLTLIHDEELRKDLENFKIHEILNS
jgi:hypothetical protein